MTLPPPGQQFFSIGDVCALTELKPHVLRYWEGQFRFLSPAKNRSGNRVYKAREVELIMLVKHLLYTEKFTIEGARQRLDHYRKNGELKAAARDAMRDETVQDIRERLEDVLAVLDGRKVAPRALPAEAASVPVTRAHRSSKVATAATVPTPPPTVSAPAPRATAAPTRTPLAEHGEDQLALG
ncbi:MAG TPA: MerR family transcriptional regulator [Gemmatimonadales bacterium]|jgi:DNA-binding transcriptional MerR regulator